MHPPPHEQEEELLRSVAIQNAQSILLARQRAEQQLVAANEALEARSAELERANELIRTIAENAASGLLMLDASGVATYMNPAASEETGYTFEELSRAPFHDVLHAPTERGGHAGSSCPIRNAREEMKPLRHHLDLFVRKNGSTFPVSCSLAPLQRDGVASGAVLEFRDITDEQLAQRSLEEASRRKDQFLATLSHELRTPMTSVLGWAKMLRYGLSESDTREAIAAIEKSAEIQAQLIDDVLDVSRIVSGNMTFKPTPVEVAPVLQAAVTTVHPAAAAKSIEVLVNVAPDLPRVLGDEGRLQQVVWNLLANAVKFTPKGGTITLRAARIGSLLRIKVKDTGKGIDPDYLPHVFEAFTQEDSSSTRSHEGIGLGLSIARSLVELHGGRIRASSEGVGRGATFTVDLPFIESSATVPGLKQPPAGDNESPAQLEELPSLNGLRVLVIDDQALTRHLVSAIFRSAKADIKLAESVPEGLAEFAAWHPEVVVCDLAMPHQDGFDFLRSVRAMRGAPSQTPIIALTAFSRPEDRTRVLEAGFDDYLKKPVEPYELVIAVQRAARPR